MGDGKEPIILAIETSQRAGGVAVRDAQGQGHAERLSSSVGYDSDLIPAIDRLYARLGLAPAQTRVVGVSVGPGGFTGLRIAVTTAKMLGVLGAELIAVPSAQVAAQSYDGPGPILVALASKRETAWVTRLDRAGPVWAVADSGRIADADTLDLGGIRAVLADAYLPESMQAVCRDKQVKVVEPEFEPLACLEIVTHLYEEEGRTVDPLILEPTYPRPPEAVTSWKKRHPQP